jgi:uncharacterized RDD family membrane protein YckC
MGKSNLSYCKKCKKKGFNFQQGIVCELTQLKPNFEGFCPNYVENPEKAQVLNETYSGNPLVEGQVDGWVRFANYFIDRVIIILLSFLAGVVIALNGYYATISTLESYLLSYTLIIMYFSLMEGLTGRTVGKFVTGTIVVNENGFKPEFSQIIGRTFCRLIPFEAFSFLGESHSGWHDTISKTKVIKRSVYLDINKESDLLDENLS